jgi:hypothetical protein
LLRFLVALDFLHRCVEETLRNGARGSKLLEEIAEMNASPGWRQRIFKLTAAFSRFLQAFTTLSRCF